MFAARNARQPVRHVWTGEQLHANCARGPRELALLVQHGQRIKGIVNWRRVRHVDSRIALAIGRWVLAAKPAKVRAVHAGAGREASHARDFLSRYFEQALLLPDLGRALKNAESTLSDELAGERSQQTTVMHEQISLFEGMSAIQLTQMRSCMRERLFLR